MSQKRAYGVNWEPYRDEIIDLYVRQNKTASVTVQHLLERHGLQVTLRQFKYEFDGYKKLSADDWKAGILPQIRRRSRTGKESNVYFRGKPVCPKRIRRAEALHGSASSDDILAVDTSGVVGSSLEDRICIRTPPPAHAEESTDSLVLGSSLVESGMRSILQQTPGMDPMALSLDFTTDNFSQADFGAFDGTITNFDIFQDLDFGFPVRYTTASESQWLCTGLPTFNPATTDQNDSGMTQLRFPSGRHSLSFDVIRTYLLSNLPFFKLQGMAPNTLSQNVRDRLKSTPESQLSGPYQNLDKLNNYGELLDQMVICTNLKELIPAKYSSDYGKALSGTEASNKSTPFRCIFEAAAFLASNNALDAANFILLVFRYQLENFLMHFLGLGTPGTKILGMQLMEFSAARRQTNLVKQLWASGVSIDHVAEDLLRIDDPDFRRFTLSRLSAKSQRGEAGGRLLMTVVDVKDIASANFLIQAGADINFLDTQEHTGLSSPILRAVNSESIGMVRLIVENGASVSSRSYTSYSTYITPLTVAVKLGQTTIARYLLDHGAAIEGQIKDEPLISYLATQMPQIYSTLVEQEVRGGISENDVLAAASNKKSMLHFLSEHFISAQMAEKALERALRMKKTKEAIHMVQQGVLRECSNKALGLVLKSATEYGTSFASLVLLVMLLIQEGADANIRGLLDPFLMKDVWEDQQPKVVISLLIDAGFNLEEHGARAVEQALRNELEDAALFLIESGTDINSYGQCFTPFQAIASEGDIATLKDLARQGAKINQPAHPHRGRTALQSASLGKCLTKMAFLVSSGAEVNARPAMIGGMTALEATVRPRPYSLPPILHGIDCIKSAYFSILDNESAADAFHYLLKHGAYVNREDGSDSPLLHDIIERGMTNLLDEALNFGARTDGYWGTHSSSSCARTPIQLAAEGGAFKAVQLLTFHGAHINALAANHFGRTALQAAAASKNASTEMIRFLLNHGADVNAPPAQDGGITALQGAAIQGYINIALLLIEHGAEVNAMPALCNGRTAIEGAAEHGRLDMVQLLLNAGAVGDEIGGKGFSEAIKLAGNSHRDDIVELLEAHTRS